MNDENKPLNNNENNKTTGSKENAATNTGKASETPHNDRHNGETQTDNRPTGKPSTLQDKWCNFLVAIGLLGVIVTGAYNIFYIPEEKAPAEKVLQAEPMEEAEEEGEPIDEDLMPLPPVKQATPADTLKEVSEEKLKEDSLHALPADTAAIHPTPSHTEEKKHKNTKTHADSMTTH